MSKRGENLTNFWNEFSLDVYIYTMMCTRVTDFRIFSGIRNKFSEREQKAISFVLGIVELARCSQPHFFFECNLLLCEENEGDTASLKAIFPYNNKARLINGRSQRYEGLL